MSKRKGVQYWITAAVAIVPFVLNWATALPPLPKHLELAQSEGGKVPPFSNTTVYRGRPPHDQHPLMRSKGKVKNLVIPVIADDDRAFRDDPLWAAPWRGRSTLVWIFEAAGDRRELPGGGGATGIEAWGSYDRDGDGLPDAWERIQQPRLYEASAAGANGGGGNPDNDGASNVQEYNWGTDPWNADTDGDGMTDGYEIQYGLDPTDDGSKPVPDIPPEILALYPYLHGINMNGADGDPDQDVTQSDGGINIVEFLKPTPTDPNENTLAPGNIDDPDTLPPWPPADVSNVLEFFFFGTLGFNGYSDIDNDIFVPDPSPWPGAPLPGMLTTECPDDPSNYFRTPSGALRPSNPLDPDTDDDGLPDGWEIWYYDPADPYGGPNPLDDGRTPDANGEIHPACGPDGDPDLDGLTNAEEFLMGSGPAPAATPEGRGTESVKSYFADMSRAKFSPSRATEFYYGQFQIETFVAPYVILKYQKSYYARHPERMIEEALRQLEDSGFNFSLFDANEDGWIDNLCIVHQGQGQELTGNPDHVLSGTYYLDQPVEVGYWKVDTMPDPLNPYAAMGFGWGPAYTHEEPDATYKAQRAIILPEILEFYEADPAQQQQVTLRQEHLSIGPICHEIAHSIGLAGLEDGREVGLPDLFDNDPGVQDAGAGVGDWGLMGTGTWNYVPGAQGLGDPTPGDIPAPLCPWAKIKLGWIQPEKMEMDGRWKELSAHFPRREVFWVDEGMAPGEYLLVEVKMKQGFVRFYGCDPPIQPAWSSPFDQPLPIPADTDPGLVGLLQDTAFTNSGDGGLLIWHIDDNTGKIRDNNVNTGIGGHPRVSVVQADGLNDLENYDPLNQIGNTADEGDLFPILNFPDPNEPGRQVDMSFDSFQRMEELADGRIAVYPTTDSYTNGETDIRFAHMQRGTAFEVGTCLPYADSLWADTDHTMFNFFWHLNHRYLWFSADKDRPAIVVKKPNGYYYRYPYDRPNGDQGPYGPAAYVIDDEDLKTVGTNEIWWDATDSTGPNVRIDLYENDEQVFTIANSVPNDGFYAWTVSQAARQVLTQGADESQTVPVYGRNYLIKITDTSDPSVCDFSDDYFGFSETDNELSLTTLAGPLQEATAVTISWQADESIERVNVDLYFQGQFYETIANNLLNTGTVDPTTGLVSGTVSWIPGEVPIEQRNIGWNIRVSDASNPNVFAENATTLPMYQVAPDYADVVLSALTVFWTVDVNNQPVALPVAVAGKPVDIFWTTTHPTTYTVNINLYKDDTFVRYLRQEFPNVGHFVWYVPLDVQAGDYRIKVVSSQSAALADNYAFSAEFSILPAAWIVFPAGAAELNAINWNYEPFGQMEFTDGYSIANIIFASAISDPDLTYRLEYLDAGGVWRPIPGAESLQLEPAQVQDIPVGSIVGQTGQQQGTVPMVVATRGNFPWDTSGLTIPESRVRIIVNQMQNIFHESGPFEIDHTPPEIVGLRFGDRAVSPLPSIVVDPNDPLSPVVAEDVDIHSPIEIVFDKQMDREQYWTKGDGVVTTTILHWPWASWFKLTVSESPLIWNPFGSDPDALPEPMDADFRFYANPGMVTWSGNSLIYYPQEPFVPNVVYYVKVWRDARDKHMVGNEVGVDYAFSFTTADFEPPSIDSDFDGIPDDVEKQYPAEEPGSPGLNPFVADAHLDADGDGVSNAAELALGTNPIIADSDRDRMPDGWELSWGFDPLLDDAWVDSDGDRLTNLEEFKLGTDPTDPNSPVTVYVDAANDFGIEDGSQEHPWTTIQKGIDNALAPAIVIVAEGTYRENIEMKNGIALFSATRYGATIDGGDTDTVVTFADVPVARMDWFVITGGNSFTGGGISCVNSPVVISRNKIISNQTRRYYYDLGGGGIYLENSDALIRCNEILRNTSAFLGGGILSFDSSPLIIGNVIAKNVAEVCGGAAYMEQGSPVLSNNTIVDNAALWGPYGGVFYHHAWNVPFYTYRQNAGAWVYYDNPIYNYRKLGYPFITNCIIRSNGIQVHGVPLSAVWHSNLEGGVFPWEYSNYFEEYWDFDMASWEGHTSTYWEGYDDFTSFYFNFYSGYGFAFFTSFGQESLNFNIDSAPMFKDPANDDYHLRPWSAGIDAGTDETAFTSDIDDEPAPIDGDNDSVVVTDIGADEFIDSDWDDLPDYWEREFFGDLSHDGTTDTNGDGEDDLTEYQHNGDPVAPLIPDSDQDGMPDYWETNNGLNPAVDDSAEDPDEDGLTNLEELRNGTDPNNPDTDDDGLSDADEVIWAPTNPLNPDTDGDGLNDYEELWVYNSDPLNPDTDGDGFPDGFEIEQYGNFDYDGSGDEDGDGLTDLEEFLRGTDPTNPDTDGDGLSDAVETNTRVYVDENDTGTDPLNPDTDGDGWLDPVETNTGVYVDPDNTGSNPNTTDGDLDGLPDTYEIGRFGDYSHDGTQDTDSDGMTDLQEFYAGTDPTNPDSDEDGLLDGVETNTGEFIDPNNTGTDPLNPDTDGDGLLDGVETNTGTWVDETDTGTSPVSKDTDKDTLDDGVETNTGVFVDENDTGSNPLSTDTDGDGLLDGDEVWLYGTDPNKADTDGDGLDDKQEIDVLLTDMLSADTDGDGLNDFDELFVYFSDPFDPDTDDDGLPDGWEIDNFGNFDRDGTGDADDDGLTDLEEFSSGADPNNADTDGDGLRDDEEVKLYHTDPANSDTDGDGLSDKDEVLLYNTDPVKADMDDDGLTDGEEILVYGSLPRNPDTDGDGMPDGFEIQYFGDFDRDGTGDLDGDQLNDLEEFEHGTDPTDEDTDDDGLNDKAEVTRGTDPLNPDTDGDGLTDGDEVASGTDPLKYDTDDDGLSDAVETNTGVFVDETDTGSDPRNADTDEDYLTDGDEVNVYGSDPNVKDTDDDGMPDWWEADADQDGVSDAAEVRVYGTDPRNDDTDGDGMPDGYEIGLLNDPNPLDPLVDDAADDRDSNNETNLDEFLNSGYTPPTPLDPLTDDSADDRDGDGTNNLDEFNNSDTDNDGLSNQEEIGTKPPTDPLDPDMDDDGLLDGEEVNRTIPDPNDPNDPPQQIPAPTNPRKADTDGDGMPDDYEIDISTNDPDHPLDPLAPDADQDRNPDDQFATNLEEYYAYDQDGDGLTTADEQTGGTDPRNFDTDGDGLVDGAGGVVATSAYPGGVDADGDNFVDGEADLGTDPRNPDSDSDLLPDGWEVLNGTDPNDPVGVNGAGGDIDGDGISNLDEYLGRSDADADGLSDEVETNTGVYVDENDTGTDPQNPDTDGDGLPDGWEVAAGIDPNDPTGDNGADGDIDGDGITNLEEYIEEVMSVDTDGDGLPDIFETNTGVYVGQNDTGTDPNNPDTDGDTIPDNVETATGVYVDQNDTGTDPNNPDTDGDGLPDNVETATGVFVDADDPGTDPNAWDSDGDWLGDGAEINGTPPPDLQDQQTPVPATDPTLMDTDGDGMPDSWEVRLANDPEPLDPLAPDANGDRNNDGQRNIDEYLAADSDGDGLSNNDELFGLGTNPYSQDSDGDGLDDNIETGTGVFVNEDDTGSDPLDTDTDDDTLTDGAEVNPGTDVAATDPNLPDTDFDGLDDYEEIFIYNTNPRVWDMDGDDVSDGDEILVHGTMPSVADTDGDGLSEGDEIFIYGTDPLDWDTDGDGLSDGDEIRVYRTDPLNPDTDGDGVDDGTEVAMGSDPTRPTDTDHDSMPDGWEITNGFHLTVDESLEDPDGDGLNNVGEYVLKTNPNDAASPDRVYYVSSQIGDDAWDGTSPIHRGGTDGPKRTIQSAIDAARTPAIIRVAAGTYVENLAVRSGIALLGEGAGRTIIVPAVTGNVVSFDGASGVIDGFTIAGAENLHGAKVYCYNASVVITHNLITGSLPPGAPHAIGVGIYCNSCPLVHIARNRIIGNYNEDLGGGIFSVSSFANIRTNLIAHNTAEAGGGGICVKDGSPEIINNTIANNSSSFAGGGILNLLEGSPHISNCIIWGNGDDIAGVSVEMINHCDIEDGDFDGERGNFSLDPLFKSPATGDVLSNDYHLQVESPCIDAGTSAYVPTVDFDDEPVPFNYVMSGYYWFYFDGVDYMGWAASYLWSFFDFISGQSTPDVYDYVFQSSIDVDIGVDEVTDSDFDDVTNEVERNEWGTDPFHIDTDNDGMPDRWEKDFGFDPLADNGQENADRDLLTNAEEWMFGTDPTDNSSPENFIYVNQANGNDAWDGSSSIYLGGGVGPKATIQGGVDAATSLQDEIILLQRGYPPEIPVTIRERMWQGERREPVLVLVWPGTYNENVSMGEAVSLIGAGPDITIINASSDDDAVTFSGITVAKLSGFTITGGDPEGAKVFLYRSPATLSGYASSTDAIRLAPIISHNRITGMVMGRDESDGGTGIYCSESSPTIAYNEIVKNVSQLWAGGIHCSSTSQPVIVGNRIFDNSTDMYGGAICLGGQSSPVICRNVIVRNTAALGGGGIYIAWGFPLITNNTLVDNSEGVYNAAGVAVITNSILWGNGDDIVDVSGAALLTFCDTKDGDFVGFMGNISQDPMFKDAYWDDYHLRPQSPCVDAGDGVLSNGVAISSPPKYTVDNEIEKAPFDGNSDGWDVMDIGADEMVDLDRDLMIDAWERQFFGGLGHSGTGDADGDGLTDLEEFDFNGNPLDSDADADGLSDFDEATVYGTAPNIPDTDGDGASDYREVQWWGINWNADLDGDGTINILDPDSDGDAMPDGYEMDRGLFTMVPDADRDSDGDGLTNIEEYRLGTDPKLADTDGDGISDGDEVNVYGTNPLNPDTDGDGLPDGEELVHSTLILDPDSDDDGMPDGWEVQNSVDPLTADAVRDPDGDRLLNIEEYRFGTDPKDASSPTTTYVDASNFGSQDGSQARPWRTIVKAMDRVVEASLGMSGTYSVTPQSYGFNMLDIRQNGSSLTVTDNVGGSWSGTLSNVTIEQKTGPGGTALFVWRGDISLTSKNTAGDTLSLTGVVVFSTSASGTAGAITADYENLSLGSTGELLLTQVSAVLPPPVVIEVAEGVYFENVVVAERVFLKGAGPDGTQIHAGGSGTAVSFENVQVAKIDGFTITGGKNDEEMGGGVYCFNSTPVISNNVIRSNVARWGGGIGLKNGSDAVIFNNAIFANTANMFGGGIACDESSPSIASCTIVDNTATFGGGGIYNANGSPTVVNAILWTNGWELSGISLEMISYSDLEDGTFKGRRGNISADPKFVKGLLSRLYLADDSPCVNAGSSSAFALGLEDKTTRLDAKPDIGVADIGYHYPSSNVFHVVATSNDPADGGVVIFWTSRVGKSYEVYYTEDLGPGAVWKPLGVAVPGTGSLMSVKDTGDGSRPAPIGDSVKHRFYRVEEK